MVMRIARFTTGGDPRYAFVQNDGAEDYLAVLSGDPLFMAVEPTGERIFLAEQGVRLLSPVIPRSKVVGIGKNYADHASEMDGEPPTEPLMFFKPNTSVIGPDDPIVLPEWSSEVHHEVELAAVIGKVTRDVSPESALPHVVGWTVANDVTARDKQRSDGQWARAKGFDTACPVGPWIVTGLDVEDLELTTRVNGQVRQQARTSELIFDVAYLISFISEVTTLLPGDLVLTGTPSGVGPITAGDVVECEIEGIGVLRNPVLRREG